MLTLVETGEFIHVHGDLDARCLASLQNFVQVDGETRCDCRIDSAQSAEPITRMFASDLLKAFEGRITTANTLLAGIRMTMPI